MRARCLFLLVLLFAVTACGQRETSRPAAPPASAGLEPSQVEVGSPFFMRLQSQPQPTRMNQATTLRVRLWDKNMEPVSVAQVSADLSMPFHEMPENKVTLEQTAPGVYDGPAEFSMEGPWEVRVTARQGEVADTQMFDLRVYE